MNEILTKKLETEADVVGFFFQLEQIGLLFHPEDSPATVVNAETGKPVFTAEECDEISKRIDECYAIVDDPCEYALNAGEQETSSRNPLD